MKKIFTAVMVLGFIFLFYTAQMSDAGIASFSALLTDCAVSIGVIGVGLLGRRIASRKKKTSKGTIKKFPVIPKRPAA